MAVTHDLTDNKYSVQKKSLDENRGLFCYGLSSFSETLIRLKVMNIKKNLPYIIIIVLGLAGVVFGGITFFKKSNPNSSQTVQSQNATNPNNAGPGSGGRGSWGGQGGAGRANFKPLHGTVSSTSSDTIVMKADDGSSKNITVSSDTRISKMDNGERTTLAITDVKSGDEINVMAQDTTGSTITPRMIIIGTFSPPQGRGSYQGGPGQEQSAPYDDTESGSSI